MSLIEEALRKTQQVTQSRISTAQPETSPQPLSKSAATIKKARKVSQKAAHPTADAEGATETPISTVALGAIAVISLCVALFSIQTNRAQPVDGTEPPFETTSLTMKQIQKRVPFPGGSAPKSLPRTEPANGIELNGIVVGGEVPYAIINGDIMVIGEVIGEATIININKAYVSLQYEDGSKTRLYLEPSR